MKKLLSGAKGLCCNFGVGFVPVEKVIPSVDAQVRADTANRNTHVVWGFFSFIALELGGKRLNFTLETFNY